MHFARKMRARDGGAVHQALRIINRVLAKTWGVCAEAASLGVAAIKASSGSAHLGSAGGDSKPRTVAKERPAVGPPKPKIDLTQALRAAKTISGKPTARLLCEIVALWCGPSRLTPSEYFYYRLYDQQYTDTERRRFRGRAAQLKINKRTRPAPWLLVANDKLLFQAITQGLGYPTPEILATYHPSRAFGQVPSLRSATELAAFLRGGTCYPCFAKPVLGMHSRGAYAITALDRANGDALRFWDGGTMDVDTFAETLDPLTQDGYLFQALREPHPAIAAICGPRLATVRLVIILQHSGPTVFRALWKVPTGTNIADNFWRPGNILCSLDSASGTVRRAVRGYGPALEDVDKHPDSGARLIGFTLPCWRELLTLAASAARSFAPLRLQAWDVAICSEGPLLIEVNVGGDYNLPQLATGRGIMDEIFAEFLAGRSHAGSAAYY
jgi:hypothetical protein